ncbi:MAG TPA: toll/interleukin-1 receptor domain-containing protein [Roseiarcus sp.]|nr:toll/interleukin-1 receptor domain-containing protein [Roseiarcus sp.]
MADVWSFISYAHDDNLPTGGGQDEEGFVSFLHRMLQMRLRDQGVQEAKLWRDAKRFSKGDPYDVEIEDALKKSELLIIVMSRNWLKRPYCLKEFNEFVRLRQSDGVSVEERIVVVGKQFIPREQRPGPLRVQEGFAFFDRDPENDVEIEKPFFDLGKICNDRFLEVRNDLATHLLKRVQLIAAGGGTGTSLPPDIKIAAPNGRTVYLAKPAVDMEQAYNRLALELQGRGYSVAPDLSSNIPNTGARDYVDEALRSAELSIHLLGDKPGFAPDDDDLPRIVKLQLMRARERAAAAQGADDAKFRRVVWAPKVLETGVGAGAAIGERDPIEVLSRFDQQAPSDMVDGDVISKFVEALFQYLTKTALRRVPSPPGNGNVEMFLDFNPEVDEDYGLAIALALNDEPISVVVPAAGEPAAEARAFNQNKLAACQEVLLCWGAASEVWVRAEADRLNNWRDLGRAQQFDRCSLVVGPPPANRKKALNVLFRKDQFDKIVNLADKEALTGDMLSDVAPSLRAAPP